MSVEENKALLKRYFEEVLNKGNVSAVDQYIDENYTMRGASGAELIKGRKAAKEYWGQARVFAPDLHATIDEMVAEGDSVAAAGTWEGTNTGESQGNPPTGKHFKYGYIAIYSFAGGKIAGGRIISDTLSLYQQLGVTPPTG